MSDSVRPHRRQPTRLPCPWDSPGKSTGVGCHCLLQYMKVKTESEVAQSCLTLLDPMDCSLPGSSIHGIFQARVLQVTYSVPPCWILKIFKVHYSGLSWAQSSVITQLPGNCGLIKNENWAERNNAVCN